MTRTGLDMKGGDNRSEEGLPLGRRRFLAWSGLGALGASLGLTAGSGQTGSDYAKDGAKAKARASMPEAGQLGTMGGISDAERKIFDPTGYLTDWNFSYLEESVRPRFYKESTLSNGQRLREYLFIARDRTIEIAPGLYFPAWTYNDRVPGPTIRANEGDRIRVWFINEGSHPHTIHFHGWHPYPVDGSLEEQFVEPASGAPVEEGDNAFGPGADPAPWEKMGAKEMRRRGLDIYEFDAEPVGIHLYHCHSVPLKRHIHKGLYGIFLVDPAGEGHPADRRPKIDPDTNETLPSDHPVREFMMVMNGFDTNFDADNEIYSANTFAFHYMREPIPVKTGDLVRIYLVNLTEFDPINSFHLHAGFFRVYRTGTTLRSEEYTDTVMMCQAERAILEFRFREGWPGLYMFHAHQSEFAELGWMGLFRAQETKVNQV